MVEGAALAAQGAAVAVAEMAGVAA